MKVKSSYDRPIGIDPVILLTAIFLFIILLLHHGSYTINYLGVLHRYHINNFLQKFAEQIAHGATLGSILFTTKATVGSKWNVEDLKGNKRPLWDAYDNDGNCRLRSASYSPIRLSG